MLALHGQAAGARTPQEQTALARQVAGTDAPPDRLICDLHRLAPEETAGVEREPSKTW